MALTDYFTAATDQPSKLSNLTQIEYNMAEGYHGHELPESSGAMEGRATQNTAQRVAHAPFSLFVPNEVIVDILENLVPAHNFLNPVYVQSDAFTSAVEGLDALQACCLVSGRMNAIATPFLYQVIVIPNSNKLACLHETLKNDCARKVPVLCGYIESLAVLQRIVPPQTGADQCMSLDVFSSMIISIFQKSPRLAMFSLVPTGLEVFQNSTST